MSEKRIQRRQSRVLALKTLFFYFERNETKALKTCFDYVLKELDKHSADDFAWQIVSTTLDNKGKIKVLIKAFAPEYEFAKIAPINRALLMLGITEMKFMETPPVVVINEYIELSKLYGEDKSSSFINGVLDSYRKSLKLERTK